MSLFLYFKPHTAAWKSQQVFSGVCLQILLRAGFLNQNSNMENCSSLTWLTDSKSPTVPVRLSLFHSKDSNSLSPDVFRRLFIHLLRCPGSVVGVCARSETVDWQSIQDRMASLHITELLANRYRRAADQRIATANSIKVFFLNIKLDIFSSGLRIVNIYLSSSVEVKQVLFHWTRAAITLWAPPISDHLFEG